MSIRRFIHELPRPLLKGLRIDSFTPMDTSFISIEVIAGPYLQESVFLLTHPIIITIISSINGLINLFSPTLPQIQKLIIFSIQPPRS